MRITIAAVGRLRAGPEKELVEDYLKRAGGAGRALALGPFGLHEVDERKARAPEAQTRRLLETVSADAHAIVLDERGEALSSTRFARLLAGLRDQGASETAFLIGGAEGHDPAVRERADRLLSFGPMVWPHMLARVMLAEQLYRAVAILADSPYHRG